MTKISIKRVHDDFKENIGIFIGKQKLLYLNSDDGNGMSASRPVDWIFCDLKVLMQID